MDEKKPPADILDEIMNRSEKPLPSPVSYPPKFDPPPPEDTPPPPPAAEKPSMTERLLPWLGVLLGGAVLAALVLGFQLFSVNARLDGLQASIEEIRTVDELREENEKLEKENQAVESARKEAEARAEEAEQYVDYLGQQVEWVGMDREKGQMLAWLERFVREGDYLMAAVGIESYNQWYDWNWITPPLGGQPPLPGQQARYRELRQEVLDRSDYLIAEPNPRATEDNPMLWISLAEDKFGPGEQAAATRLWAILWYSTSYLNHAAYDMAHFYGDEELMAALENGAFRPSTLTLLEQLKDDLIRRGRLEEDEDGTVHEVVLYGDRNDLAMVPLGKLD